MGKIYVPSLLQIAYLSRTKNNLFSKVYVLLEQIYMYDVILAFGTVCVPEYTYIITKLSFMNSCNVA